MRCDVASEPPADSASPPQWTSGRIALWVGGVVVGLSWPFVTAVGGGVLAATVEVDPYALFAVSLAGAPLLFWLAYCLPSGWPRVVRVAAALLLVVSLTAAEVYLAVAVFTVVYVLCGGWIPA